MKIAYAVAPADITGAFMGLQGPLYEALETVARIGYEGVELFVRDPATLDVVQLKQALQEHRLTIPVIGTTHVLKQDGLSLLSPDREIRRQTVARLCRIVRLAAQLGSDISLGKVRGSREGLSELQWQEYLGEGLSALSTEARKDVHILVEAQHASNIDNLNGIAETLRFLRGLSLSPVKIHIDTYHVNLTEQDPVAAIESCRGMLGYIHCADSGRMIPSEGTIDLKRMFQACRNIGYDGWVGLEISQGPDPLATARRAFVALKHVIESSV